MTTLDQEHLHRLFGVTDAATLNDAALASRRQFVRGRSQLSLLDSGRHPTGSLITAFEALQAYGVDVLDEAVEYGSAILPKHPNAVGEALRRHREALGLDYSDVSRSTRVLAADIKRIEAGAADDLSMQVIERIAFALGMDEAQIAFHGTPAIAAIARRPGGSIGSFSPALILVFTESASIIRTQHRLQRWLGVTGESRDLFPYDDNIEINTAWTTRRLLKTVSRRFLSKLETDLQHRKVDANVRLVRMIRFAEHGLGIPVIQAELPQRIAGSTIAVSDGGLGCRGIILNTIGENENSLIRTETLLHEVRRIVFGRVERTDNVQIAQRVSDFNMILLDVVGALVGFLDDGTLEILLSTVIEMYSSLSAESFGRDYCPIPNVPILRRGRFSGLVVDAWKQNFISLSTAANYIGCSTDMLQTYAESIRSVHREWSLASNPQSTGNLGNVRE